MNTQKYAHLLERVQQQNWLIIPGTNVSLSSRAVATANITSLSSYSKTSSYSAVDGVKTLLVAI